MKSESNSLQFVYTARQSRNTNREVAKGAKNSAKKSSTAAFAQRRGFFASFAVVCVRVQNLVRKTRNGRGVIQSTGETPVSQMGVLDRCSNMIDSHCHLTDSRLLEQLDAVLSRARESNVTRMITIGTRPDDDLAAIDLCRKHPDVLRCAIGIHPNYCHEVDESELPKLRELQDDPSVVALGEMGLDYHYNFADRARQRKFFEAQLQLAAELDRPVVIHCREAVDDTLSVLRGFPTVPAVFHCFTGTIDEGERILGAGYLLGFTGAVTFRKSDDLRELVRRGPEDRLLIETDAPYLTPEPMRKQKVNEPALVVHVARAVAEARGVDIPHVDRVTSENARRFFGWE